MAIKIATQVVLDHGATNLTSPGTQRFSQLVCGCLKSLAFFIGITLVDVHLN